MEGPEISRFHASMLDCPLVRTTFGGDVDCTNLWRTVHNARLPFGYSPYENDHDVHGCCLETLAALQVLVLEIVDTRRVGEDDSSVFLVFNFLYSN
jgi:hypothetical protein